MRIPHAAVPRLRMLTVVGFTSVCALLFGYLWVNMGGRLPLVSSDGYRVSFAAEDVDNLVYDSDVMVAGVKVGKVRQLDEEGGKAHVVLQIDDDAALPLHEGAQLRLRSKSLIEETYVEIVDGSGAEVPDGGELPGKALIPSVQLDDVLASLDDDTRADLGAALRSLSASTDQTGDQIAATLTGLGDLGREGYDVLDALDTGQGRNVDQVDQAGRLTSTTAAQQQEIEETVHTLPGVLTTAQDATTSLSRLAKDLRPITRGVDEAAPTLSKALTHLPATTRDLRALLPSLDATIDKAPATLERVPGVADDLVKIIPTARATLADVNPMLAFIQPYGPDLAAFIANWNAMLGNSDVNGHYLRIFPVLNEQSFKGLPLPLNKGILDKSNAYPAPGESVHPGPYEGKYPHVEQDSE